MTELERFWHWYDNEQPGLRKGAPMLHRNVGERGRIAINVAIEHVSRAAGLRGQDEDWAPVMPIVRDLSLAIAAGLDRMDSQLRQAGYLEPEDGEDEWDDEEPRG